MTNTERRIREDAGDATMTGHFAEWVLAQRKRRAWTQGDLAKFASLPLVTISRIELKKVVSPKQSTINKIVQAFGRDAVEDFNESEEQRVQAISKETLRMLHARLDQLDYDDDGFDYATMLDAVGRAVATRDKLASGDWERERGLGESVQPRESDQGDAA